MFKTTRHTLRAGRDSRRSTLKQQRGGGNVLIGFCSWRTDPADITAAKTEWGPFLPDPFKFLVGDDNWVTQGDAEQKYIQIVQQQDKLFEQAMKLIYKTIGATEGDERSILEAYNKIKTNSTIHNKCLNYIRDIISIVYLEKNLTAAFTSTDLFQDTKFDKILKEPFLHLLINPQRVQNQFIKNMAMILYLLKKNNVFNQTKDDDDKLSLLSVRYDSVAKANALANTSIDLRDGPTVALNINEVTTMFGTRITDKYKMFMYNFLLRCAGKYYNVKSKQIKAYPMNSMPTFNLEIVDTYSILSAMVYNSYTIGNTEDLLFKINSLLFKTENIINNKPTKILTKESYINERFSTNQYRYILHLVHEIKEAEKLYATLPEENSSSPENTASAAATAQ